MKRAENMRGLAAITFAISLLLPAVAHAYRVYSPIVTPDETAIGFWGEASSASTSGTTKKPGARRAQVELRHTFFERLDLGLFLVAESGANGTAAGEGTESIGYSRTKAKALYQITDKGAHFADLGLYLDYNKFKDELPNDDLLSVMFLIEKDFGGYVLNFNPGIRKTMTAGMRIDETATYQAGFKYLYHPLFNPGVEAYGITLGPWGRFEDPNKQQQNAGPAFYGELADLFGYKVSYQGSLLFGLTKGSYDVIASGLVEIKF